MTTPTETHLGAAQRLYDDATGGKLTTELAVKRAKHLERVSLGAAAALWHHLQEWIISRRGLSAEEVPFTDDEFEDRPLHLFQTRRSIAGRNEQGTSSSRPVHGEAQ